MNLHISEKHFERTLELMKERGISIEEETTQQYLTRSRSGSGDWTPDTVEGSMVDQDWQKLMELATCTSYKKDHVIFREGEAIRNLQQIVNGRVRIEKNFQGTLITINRVEHEIIGEVAFLITGVASASVIADNDVDVYVLEIPQDILNETCFGSQFYRFLGSKLATCLNACV